MKHATLQKLLAARAAKRPIVLATRLSDGLEEIIEPAENKTETWLAKSASRVLQRDESRVVENAGDTWFLNTFNTPLRLLIVGAVHIAQPLAHMGRLAGYEVILIDPREAFAAEDRFPGLRLCTAWPDEALEALAPDHRTAVVTLTHDPKLDDPALHVALASPCFYVGALGSRKTHAARGERLREAGFTLEQIAQIHGPVGLPLGGRSPSEIAISILAQITEVLRR